MSKIFFTADTHFQHANILKHCADRISAAGIEVDDVAGHDKWLIQRWNETVGKRDTVYILGDFAFGSPDSVKKLFGKLNGKKFLILGNHDGSSEKLTNYFVQVTQMKLVDFRKSVYPFLDEDFQLFMCHYPMVSWNGKPYGACQIHGHVHGRLDKFNEESDDLRLDVGVDSGIADYRPIELETLYRKFKEKSGGEKFIHYVNRIYDEHRKETENLL